MGIVPIKDCTDLQYPAYIAKYWRSNLEARDGLRRGIADIKAGRTVKWSVLKRELGL